MASAEGRQAVRLSVPGNLLLAGEYLVLDEGGRGLAVAVEPRLSAGAQVAPDGIWSIRATMGTTSLCWRPGSGVGLPLAEPMINSCSEALRLRGRPLPDPLAIEVDSSAFFDAQGRKAGFGSSAAVAVALALLIGHAAGLRKTDLREFAAEAALSGHRAAQGGRGSGYDIFASLYGGTGIFIGGRKPQWSPLGDLPIVRGVLVPGPAPVSSSEAVKAYRNWLSGQTSSRTSLESSSIPESPSKTSAEALVLLDDLKAAVAALEKATVSQDAQAFRQALSAAGAAGRRLGEAIGYSAFIQAPEPWADLEVKALGAGNELGLMILDRSAGSPQVGPDQACLPFNPSGGPRWLS